MTLEEALAIVAAQVLHHRAEDVHDDWYELAEISEYDWERIVELVRMAAPPHSQETYEAALELLATRAEK